MNVADEKLHRIIDEALEDIDSFWWRDSVIERTLAAIEKAGYAIVPRDHVRSAGGLSHEHQWVPYSVGLFPPVAEMCTFCGIGRVRVSSAEGQSWPDNPVGS